MVLGAIDVSTEFFDQTVVAVGGCAGAISDIGQCCHVISPPGFLSLPPQAFPLFMLLPPRGAELVQRIHLLFPQFLFILRRRKVHHNVHAIPVPLPANDLFRV
jgi:hypothetical protein